ncbi:fluoride efflux transporter CrcB [Listeria costaricensis]|uniref:fluoride efflux transporter CrcB n=1 Tax=Listeria costaricensis TaxID=2026604 RepID=UPI000C068331|nr:fluoride efflux transporter CrcB [Listeria costaricensis]
MFYLYVGVFSALGGMSRYAISLILPAATFPAATLTVNLLGCFLLAIVNQILAENEKIPAALVAGMGTGFVGAFTTFSTFSVDNIRLLMAGHYGTAISYMLISLIGGLLMAALGYLVAAKYRARRRAA